MSGLPSPDSLRQLIDYNPVTGELRWKRRPASMFRTTARVSAETAAARWNGRFASKPALAALSKGYLVGNLAGVMLKAHRVAWAITHGHWPASQIDHANGNRGDNRLINLRAVEPPENSKNQKISVRNTSGVMGVSFDRSRGKWVAQIRSNRQQFNIGRFASFDEAVAARKIYQRRLGFHPNHGTRT